MSECERGCVLWGVQGDGTGLSLSREGSFGSKGWGVVKLDSALRACVCVCVNQSHGEAGSQLSRVGGEL